MKIKSKDASQMGQVDVYEVPTPTYSTYLGTLKWAHENRESGTLTWYGTVHWEPVPEKTWQPADVRIYKQTSDTTVAVYGPSANRSRAFGQRLSLCDGMRASLVEPGVVKFEVEQ